MFRKIWDFLAGRTEKGDSLTGCGCYCDEPFNTPILKKPRKKRTSKKKT